MIMIMVKRDELNTLFLNLLLILLRIYYKYYNIINF